MSTLGARLDRRIVVERATVTRDTLGNEVLAWATLAEVDAEVRQVSDGERWRAGEVAAELSARFRIRWGLSVTVRDRIRHDGRVHEIVGVKEIGRQLGQEITAAARAEQEAPE